MSSTKNHLRNRRKARIRSKISGTAARPRLCVFRSLTGIYAQVIDDTTGTVLAAATSQKAKKGSGIDQAKEVGATVASAAKAKKVTSVVFDRNGFNYHGRVKALAEAAREGGLEF